MGTGVILENNTVKITPATNKISANRGDLGKPYSQDAPVSELILKKMLSFRKEQNRQNWGLMNIMIKFLILLSFLCGGMLCYYHWEAMLVSYLSMRVTRMPFTNMQELYKSDYKFTTIHGSAYHDKFRYGDDIWQKIYKEKLEFPEVIEIEKVNKGWTASVIDWMLLDDKNAAYNNALDMK